VQATRVIEMERGRQPAAVPERDLVRPRDWCLGDGEKWHGE
jgi:hypothetical protein